MGQLTYAFLKTGILIASALFAFFGLTMISIVFSYLDQSSQTPELKQLRFYNHLLPCLLTVGFIFYFTFDHITQKAKDQRSIAWIRTTVIGLAAIGAIPWQIEHLKWQLQKESFAYFEPGTYLIEAIFTIGTIIGELKNYKERHEK